MCHEETGGGKWYREVSAERGRSNLRDMKYANRSCFVCNASDFTTQFRGRAIDGHMFFNCSACGVVVARPLCAGDAMDYTNYGDYLTDDRNVAKQLESTKKSAALLLAKYSGKRKSLLDYGAGAGYFVRAATDLGLSASGVEPSSKLREFARSYLGVRLHGHLSEVEEHFDVITLFDVIEHIPELNQRELMSDLLSKLKPGGILLGNTPNWRSANRLIRAERDPAIWPPSHVSYFTLGSLDTYFKSLGLEKKSLYSNGFRTFRAQKNEYSFLEKPPPSLFLQWCIVYPLKVGIRLLSCIFSPLGLGYQIYFEYKRR